jgi:hypothetical protein
VRSTPETADREISQRVIRDVTDALQSIRTIENKFIVNDTPWFQLRPTGTVTPCVMNAAGFISSRFLQTLADEDHGWEKNREIRAQEIDGYIELQASRPRRRIPPQSFIEFFALRIKAQPVDDLRRTFLSDWHKYVEVGIPTLAGMQPRLRRFFERSRSRIARRVRIALEFETGHIASSFRALDKLESLFVLGEIDFGVFVTSINKADAAARIWPASNRNGSFQELENRNYRNNRTIPLWELGFQPDEFRRDAPYLGTRSLYAPVSTGKTLRHQGTLYEVFTRDRRERVLRIPDHPST